MNKAFLLAASLILFGCTNAEQAQILSLGSPAEVTCFAADGKVFYHGFSTGKVSTESQSDGWFFQEQGTHDLIRVSGACLIRNPTM